MRRGRARAAALAVLLAAGAASGAARAKSAPAAPAPFRIFDDVYYVGTDWVSAYLIATEDGLILIDALYGEFTDRAVEGIRRLGFVPGDVRYVLVTHGHYDHAGGARRLQETLGARVGMTAADWALVESGRESKEHPFEPPRRDLVLRDGDAITLGGTTVNVRVTPGHTPGVLSLEFPVRDGDHTHRAFVFGGIGLNFSGEARTRQYIESVRRIRALEGIEVNLTNHPGSERIFERAAVLAARGPGEPHPFVSRDDFVAWLENLESRARRKLEEERRAAMRSNWRPRPRPAPTVAGPERGD